MDTIKPKTVDEYIALALPGIKEPLERIRTAILEEAPDALECISYEMPAYKQNGILVYFGGFTKHVSLFPGSEAIAAFELQLVDYKTSKGTIRFPINKELPLALIKEIVRFRIKANEAKKKPKK